jgi:hypothetical protein
VDKSVGIKVKYCILLDELQTAASEVNANNINNIGYIRHLPQLQQAIATG